MESKYAWEHKDDPTWLYWEIEYSQLWNDVWRHHQFCPIGKHWLIKNPAYRTVPVTEEYYLLFAKETL